MLIRRHFHYPVLFIAFLSSGLAACGGSGSSPQQTIQSRELLDLTPGANDQFGTTVVQLGNGNIVVVDSNDSSIVANGGAVHLYSPLSSTPIASIYGDVAGDSLGSTSITALGNNNVVIASRLDDEGGVSDAGSVRLVDGSTGGANRRDAGG